MRKDAVLQIRCTSEQMQEWRATAERAGTTLHDWVRDTLDAGTDLTSVADRLQRRTAEVKRGLPTTEQLVHAVEPVPPPRPAEADPHFKPDFKGGRK
jgi:hypothetical protein